MSKVYAVPSLRIDLAKALYKEDSCKIQCDPALFVVNAKRKAPLTRWYLANNDNKFHGDKQVINLAINHCYCQTLLDVL